MKTKNRTNRPGPDASTPEGVVLTDAFGRADHFEGGTMTIKPKRQWGHGLHTCNANYGWCGEHANFRASYECTECGRTTMLDQCSAWPITVFECEGCGTTLTCELDQNRTKAVLR